MKILNEMKYIVASLFLCFFAFNSFAQEETATKKANLELTLLEADSIKTVKAKVTETATDGATPVKDVEIHFYAKKSFGLLPIGEAVSTDENGEASVEFPNDLPGDSKGNVTVIAKVEENDVVGNLEEGKSIQWGLPVSSENILNKRALWASGNNAPWPLVIIVTSVVGGVWGVIIYIFVQLIKIKKSGRVETT